MRKILKKLLVSILGGIMMTGMLAGCDNSKTVEEELQPMFEILDKQSIDGFEVVSILDTLRPSLKLEEVTGFQINLNLVDGNNLSGEMREIAGENTKSTEQVVLANDTIFDNDILSNNQLFYKEFHFSKSYFKTLEKKGVHDSVETYDKNITYVEQKLSQYSKSIISRYSLSTEAEVTIEVGKQRGGENSFNYLIIHNIFDKEKKITVRRTCVIELENTYDE